MIIEGICPKCLAKKYLCRIAFTAEKLICSKCKKTMVSLFIGN